ncbi:hypothetical protein BT69DRAFT_1330576 [Atractiella rhizophila]|nr:hypothetical protein BT69DRAFT_1330576 [Atractiella rhizophila]
MSRSLHVSATPTVSSSNHLTIPPPSLAIESTKSLVSTGSRSPSTEERTMNIVFATGNKGKGEGKARAQDPAIQQIIALPDDLPLPVSLNQISVIL